MVRSWPERVWPCGDASGDFGERTHENGTAKVQICDELSLEGDTNAEELQI